LSKGKAEVRLWLINDGPSGAARVSAASQKAPRRGRRVEVSAPAAVLEQGSIWLLTRKEPADVVLAVDASPEPLEARRAQLGKVADQYEIVQVPLLERTRPD
jgi:hypothetical protein